MDAWEEKLGCRYFENLKARLKHQYEAFWAVVVAFGEGLFNDREEPARRKWYDYVERNRRLLAEIKRVYLFELELIVTSQKQGKEVIKVLKNGIQDIISRTRAVPYLEPRLQIFKDRVVAYAELLHQMIVGDSARAAVCGQARFCWRVGKKSNLAKLNQQFMKLLRKESFASPVSDGLVQAEKDVAGYLESLQADSLLDSDRIDSMLIGHSRMRGEQVRELVKKAVRGILGGKSADWADRKTYRLLRIWRRHLLSIKWRGPRHLAVSAGDIDAMLEDTELAMNERRVFGRKYYEKIEQLVREILQLIDELRQEIRNLRQLRIAAFALQAFLKCTGAKMLRRQFARTLSLCDKMIDTDTPLMLSTRASDSLHSVVTHLRSRYGHL